MLMPRLQSAACPSYWATAGQMTWGKPHWQIVMGAPAEPLGTAGWRFSI